MTCLGLVLLAIGLIAFNRRDVVGGWPPGFTRNTAKPLTKAVSGSR
jgi:hypothetical protein